jgi:hypothetical protein
MANPKKQVAENVPGDFFVDSTCIDCDACRQIAPGVFGQARETSFVHMQPVSADDRRQAIRALLAWAVVSFHTVLAEELIEDREGPSSSTRQRRYLDEVARVVQRRTHP